MTFESFEVKHNRHQVDLNLLLNVAKQPKYHYFAAEQQPLLSLPDKASHVSRTVFLSNLIEISRAQLTKGLILFICDPLTNKYISLIYDTLFNSLFHYQIHHLNCLTEYGRRYNPWTERVYFEFLLLIFSNVSLPHSILLLNNHGKKAYIKPLDKK